MIIFNLPSNWNREIKDSQHFRSGFFDKQIADDGWRDRGVAGLPNADHGSHGKERMVILKKIHFNFLLLLLFYIYSGLQI